MMVRERSSTSPSAPSLPSFELTPKQSEAIDLLSSGAQNVLLRGGSRSGKTFVLMLAVVTRALRAPGSTHAVLRFRFNHIKQSIIYDTFPKVMGLCYAQVGYDLNKTDWFAELPNGSKILFGGLDDKERSERILGQEHSTIYLNECSQISYSARNKAMTRLAQKSGLKLVAYYDANPPTVGHWTYRMFEQKLEPTSGKALANPGQYASMMMNPADNLRNLPSEYISTLEALPEKERRRFLLGQYLDQVENGLWSLDLLERGRIAEEQLPQLTRVIVGIDPSGCSGPEDVRSDEVGIVVAGVDAAGIGYVLEDCSGRYGPEGWAARALQAFDEWQADAIVAEGNFGGAMVESTLRTVRRTAPIKLVHASRGKAVRAEPVASLYSQGLVRHLDTLPELEDQLCQFSTAGYEGARSPDRADAAVWALTDLMLGASKRRLTLA